MWASGGGYKGELTQHSRLEVSEPFLHRPLVLGAAHNAARAFGQAQTQVFCPLNHLPPSFVADQLGCGLGFGMASSAADGLPLPRLATPRLAMPGLAYRLCCAKACARELRALGTHAGAVYIWGGYGPHAAKPEPTPRCVLPSRGNKKVTLATGRHHGAISDGEHVWTVGYGGDGCLGLGSTADAHQVTAVASSALTSHHTAPPDAHRQASARRCRRLLGGLVRMLRCIASTRTVADSVQAVMMDLSSLRSASGEVRA